MGLLALSTGVSAVQRPIAKGTGHGCCSKKKLRMGSAMFRPIDEARETAKLSGQTLGKIYDQLIKNQHIYKDGKNVPFLCKLERQKRLEPSSKRDDPNRGQKGTGGSGL